MRWIAAFLLTVLSAFGQYPYHSDTFTWSTIPAEWSTNNEYAFRTSGGYLTNDNVYSSGYLKSMVSPPSTTGEIKTALRLQASGGAISHYLGMSDGAWVMDPSGYSMTYRYGATWLRVDLQNITVNGGNCSGTLAITQAIAGTYTSLASMSVGCHDGLQMRSVVAMGKLLIYFDGALIFGPYTPLSTPVYNLYGASAVQISPLSLRALLKPLGIGPAPAS